MNNLADMLVLPASLASGKTTFEVKEDDFTFRDKFVCYIKNYWM